MEGYKTGYAKHQDYAIIQCKLMECCERRARINQLPALQFKRYSMNDVCPGFMNVYIVHLSGVLTGNHYYFISLSRTQSERVRRRC